MAEFHSGFVALLGRPNVGKSTLMNRLVGQKVAIVSPRPQTTRNRIMGVVTKENAQMVLLDTPGLHTPRTKLGERMMKEARDALQDIDGLLLLVDAGDFRDEDRRLIDAYAAQRCPKAVAVNKIDEAPREQVARALARLNDAAVKDIYPISARTGEGVEELFQLMLSWLPEGPRYFPDDMVTDKPERFFIAELVREKALIHLREEVPHGVGVEVQSMSTTPSGLCEIHAAIYCERDAHKGILIGKQGSMLRTIGQEARADIEKMLGARVDLRLFVKVRERWRDSNDALRDLGYDD